MVAHCSSTPRKPTSHSYFVLMQDYGKRGLEAVVHPEDTRSTIINMLKSGEAKHVAFIHHVDGLLIEDVTTELFDEAEMELKAEDRHKRDTQADRFDHLRDLRKHSEAAE